MSLLMCIGPDGIKGSQVKDGGFNTESFFDFLIGLAARHPEVRRGDVCLVMDNVAFHHARVVDEFCAENGIRKMYLPRYAQELNPIENVFGFSKRGSGRRESSRRGTRCGAGSLTRSRSWRTISTSARSTSTCAGLLGWR